jgi:outer membrane lipoprotein-sorting protein
MKYQRSIFGNLSAIFVAVLATMTGARAQMNSAMVQGPQFSGPMAKLFGDHQSFSATMEFQTESGQGRAMTMDGGIAYLNGMSRFEMDLSQMQGAGIKPGAMAQMKRMGMDKIVAVSIPAKKIMRSIYPSMNSYVETAIPDSTPASSSGTDYKVTVTETGSETVAGHPCIKNKVVVTAPDGVSHESTVWNATDLDKFPVKIEMSENGKHVTMTFKDVKLDKPDAALFDPPADCKKYGSMMDMMMSRARGGQ